MEYFVIPEYIKNAAAFIKNSVKDMIENGELFSDFKWDDIKLIPASCWAEYDIFPVLENGVGPYAMNNYEVKGFITGVLYADETFEEDSDERAE